MWKPTQFRGLGSKYRLGQLPQSVVNQAAQSVVDLAEPKVRNLIAEERLRIASAGKTALPFIALSTAGFFATSFWATKTKAKVVGYVASAAALGVGLWLGFDTLEGEEPAPAPAERNGIDLPFVSEAAGQMAKSVVAEAFPVIRELVNEERARASDAINAVLPYAGIGIVGGVLTFFAVPDDSKGLKVAGYTASVGAILVGIWQGLDTLAS